MADPALVASLWPNMLPVPIIKKEQQSGSFALTVGQLEPMPQYLFDQHTHLYTRPNTFSKTEPAALLPLHELPGANAHGSHDHGESAQADAQELLLDVLPRLFGRQR